MTTAYHYKHHRVFWAAPFFIISGIVLLTGMMKPIFAFAPQTLPNKMILSQKEQPSMSCGFLHNKQSNAAALLSSSLKAAPTDKNSENKQATADNAANNTPLELDENQIDFTIQYLNEHHGNVLLAFVKTFSDLGRIAEKQNAYTAGSYEIKCANLTSINSEEMQLQVSVQKRKKELIETVTIDLDAKPIMTPRSNPHANMPPIHRNDSTTTTNPMDDMVRRLIRLCWIVQKPSVTGLLIQMALQLNGSGIGIVKENMYLNQVPHSRYVREYFYDMCTKAVMEACVLCASTSGNKKMTNRMQIVTLFPETNPSMDSYRIGTLLELVRAITTELVVQANLRVKVCVQQSMGVGIFVGVPKQLVGVSKLLRMMDWQSEPGELCEGMVGEYLNFGGIGKDFVVNEGDVIEIDDPEDPEKKKKKKVAHQDDVFILIAPQSMVGTDTSIHGPLSEMVEAAGDRPVILLNPDLTDKVSSGGQQSFRGRQQRMDFAASFETIFQFSNLYVSGTSYFPILGSLTKLSPTQPWVAHQRRDYANDKGEVYVPILAKETKPSGDDIMTCMEIGM